MEKKLKKIKIISSKNSEHLSQNNKNDLTTKSHMDNEDVIHNIINNSMINDFKSFLRKVFDTLHPVDEFKDNWHLDLICTHLKQVENGQTKRLLINIPPRSLKSICFSVAWPAWLLGHNPGLKIIVASYSEQLSNKHSADCRHIMNSEWYRKLFPQTIIKNGGNRINKFITDQMGFRFAASVNGTLTGEGADIIIVDDPHTPMQAASQRLREKANNWFKQTLVSRLNDKKKGIIAVVMQRLHSEDLSGMLLAKKNEWTHLKLSAIAENDEYWEMDNFQYHRKKGQYIHTKRDDDSQIQRLKEEMGSYAFSAQYQQDPPQMGGESLIKTHWIQYYEKLPDRKYCKIYQSWDCAIKADSIAHDYSVCTTWAVNGNNYYLIDVFRQRLEYPYLLQAIVDLSQKFSPEAVIIEDKAAGQQLLQSIRASAFRRGFNGNNFFNNKEEEKLINQEEDLTNSLLNPINKELGQKENKVENFNEKEKKFNINNFSNYDTPPQTDYNTSPNSLKTKNTIIPAIGFNPQYDKKTRFMLITPLFEARRIFFPNQADWLEDLEQEIFAFPTVRHDDQVDSLSQFFLWIQSNLADRDSIVAANANDFDNWEVTVL